MGRIFGFLLENLVKFENPKMKFPSKSSSFMNILKYVGENNFVSESHTASGLYVS